MEKNVREPQKFLTLKNVSELFIVANIFSKFIAREHFIKVTNIFSKFIVREHFFKVVNIFSKFIVRELFLNSRIFFWSREYFFSKFIVREHFIKVTNIFPNSSFANFFWINDIFTVHAPGSLWWQRISVFWYFFIFILCRVLFITHRNSGLFAAYCYGYCLCASWPIRACQGDFGPEWHTYCTLRT